MIFDAVKRRASDKGISIYELEKRAGISTGSIAKWNESVPRSDSLYSVALILGCTMEDLILESRAEFRRNTGEANEVYS